MIIIQLVAPIKKLTQVDLTQAKQQLAYGSQVKLLGQFFQETLKDEELRGSRGSFVNKIPDSHSATKISTCDIIGCTEANVENMPYCAKLVHKAALTDPRKTSVKHVRGHQRMCRDYAKFMQGSRGAPAQFLHLTCGGLSRECALTVLPRFSDKT